MNTYVVTGASRGIGLELARQLRARGDEVVATVRDGARAPALRELGCRVETLDVGDASSVERFARAIDGIAVDVLVNNAGMGGHGQPLGRLDFGEIVRFFEVNAVGALQVTPALLPALERGRRKLVVSITSRMGSIDDNGSGAVYGYRASKAALNMFTRSMAIDLRPRGFTCVVLHPGWVKTDMGGKDAPLPVAQSVSGLVRVMDGLGKDDSGRFLDFAGSPIPW